MIVTSSSHFGPGSLPVAINAALPGTVITFDPTLDGATITLAAGASLIEAPFLKIDATALLSGLTISGNHNTRLFEVTPTSVAELCGLTIQDGSDSDCGGGILNRGILTLRECTIQGCTAAQKGGGICNDGGRLTLRNSSLVANKAIDPNLPNQGRSGGLWSDGGLSFNTVTIDHCTIADNLAAEYGGGIYHYLGLMNNHHSTVASNSTPSFGAGIATFGDLSTETHVFASIIAGNNGPDIDFVLDPANRFFSGGFNLIGTGNATGAFISPTDLPNILAPSLSPLDYYRGGTPTILPRSNSLALDRGGSDPLTPATDQRGLPRLIDVAHDGLVQTDIGAVEIGPVPFPTVTVNVTTAADSVAGSLRAALSPDIIPGTLVRFASGLDGATLALTGGEIPINGLFVKIDARDLPSGVEISGGGASRIFSTESQTEVELCGLTLRDGSALGDHGGAIRNDGFLTVRECSFENNEAMNGGAIANLLGQLTLIDSTFTMNLAGDGAAVHHHGDLLERTATIDQCTFAENFATGQGGALFNSMGIDLKAWTEIFRF